MTFMLTHFSEKFSADETRIGIGLMNSIKLDGNEKILVLSTGLSFKSIYDLFCLFLRRISAIWQFEDISLTHTQEN